MIYFLFITAFTVSIDSLICGFSLSLGKGKKLPFVIGISLTVLVMCLITNYGALLFKDYLNEKSTIIGGIILVLVGIYNLTYGKKQVSNKSAFVQSFITGFAVGIDGALANLSLSLMGINAFYVPPFIALMHAVMIYVGSTLSQSKISKKIFKLDFLPPLILILLGLIKITGLLF